MSVENIFVTRRGVVDYRVLNFGMFVSVCRSWRPHFDYGISTNKFEMPEVIFGPVEEI